MTDDDTITLVLSKRDVGRVLSLVRERTKKLRRGIEKFEDDFDPELGANMTAAYEAYSNLKEVIQNAQDNHTRSAGCDPA